VGSVTRPLKELKGFEAVTLEPGASKDIVFEITLDDLSFYRQDMTFGPEEGAFKVFVGSNSRDCKEASFQLAKGSGNSFEFKYDIPRGDL
jgi:beta-glucosidase